MPGWNKSPLAFEDVREIFNRALESERGITIKCKTRSEAITLRSRMNYLRKVDRKENAVTYQSDHPMYMRSIWDKYLLRLPPKGAPDETTIYVMVRTIDELHIEDIPGDAPVAVGADQNSV